jgi:cyclopropane fatty-acyl-phospholipid synthase-like methyltransferase
VAESPSIRGKNRPARDDRIGAGGGVETLTEADPGGGRIRRIGAFLSGALLRGRPHQADGILVYDALQVAPALVWNDAGYLNFGLWSPETRSTTEACEALLARAAGLAELADATRVLDVGFGTGAQDVFFAGLSEATIVGVNQSASQTVQARERIRAAGLAGRVDLRRGEATRLELPDAHFDVVLCIEAAFHFETRERFFAEAHRVLRPGGRLVVADIVPGVEAHWSDRIFWAAFHRIFFAPRANRVSVATYQAQLKSCGFDVRLERLTDRVYVPFFENRARGYRWWAALAMCRLLLRWFRTRPPCEYLLVLATREPQGE